MSLELNNSLFQLLFKIFFFYVKLIKIRYFRKVATDAHVVFLTAFYP